MHEALNYASEHLQKYGGHEMAVGLALKKEMFESFKQKFEDALKTAKNDGAIEGDRIVEAAMKANERGLITDEECSQFKA